MPPRREEDSVGSLEHAREELYNPAAQVPGRARLSATEAPSLPHAWEEKPLPIVPKHGERHVRVASIFFGIAALFFLVSLVVAGYFFYYGSNSVSTDKVSIDIQGPTTIVGGDTVPLSLTITNKNPVAIKNAIIEIDFPDGTRSATNVLSPYPRYTENLGTLASGATVTRSLKAIVFGGAGQTLALPVSFSYGTASSNAVFVKKVSYALAVSSTPLSVSVDSLSETVSGEPLAFALTVRSNATVPISNVILSSALPFGFTISSSSLPLVGSTISLGTLAPGASKKVTLIGILSGQDKEQRVFHFTVGTAKSAQDQTLAVSYMTQDAAVLITEPFIATKLAINNSISEHAILAPASTQSISLSYANTLPVTVSNVVVTVTVAGSGIDYDSIRTTSGFYNSVDHTIVFGPDTDPALASLAPGASGVGNFTFSTLPAGSFAPNITFTVSVSGMRIGQSKVPEQVTTSTVTNAKVATAVVVSAVTAHASGPLPSTGPVPPRVGQTTTYSIIWGAQNKGSTVAGGTVTATLPSYVSYTGVTSGVGTFSYDSVSHTVSWNMGDLAQGASAQGVFQVAITPSSSQKGGIVVLANTASFVGYDRFAGVQISAMADPVTTDMKGDSGYLPGGGIVQ